MQAVMASVPQQDNEDPVARLIYDRMHRRKQGNRDDGP